MLNKLFLKNFQGHKNLVVDLSRPVTYITGSSDAGKSSIVRALRWLFTNKPSGTAFVHQGKPGTSVRLDFDKHTVVRRRGGKVNSYELDQKEYVAFGSSVPEPITNALKLTDVNFQNQHDAPFWLSLSPGEVSRQLNSVVDLRVMDRMSASLKTRHKTNEVKIRHAEELCNTLLQGIEDGAWLPSALDSLQRLEAQSVRVKSAVSRASDMRALFMQVQGLKPLIVALRRSKLALQRATAEHSDKLTKLEAVTIRASTIRGLLKQLSGCHKSKKQLMQKQRAIEKEIKQLTKGRCPICQSPINQ